MMCKSHIHTLPSQVFIYSPLSTNHNATQILMMCMSSNTHNMEQTTEGQSYAQLSDCPKHNQFDHMFSPWIFHMSLLFRTRLERDVGHLQWK